MECNKCGTSLVSGVNWQPSWEKVSHRKCSTCAKVISEPHNAFIKWQEIYRGMGRTEMRKYNQEHPEERKADKIMYDGGNVVNITPTLPRFDDGSPSTLKTSKVYMPSGATKEGPGFVYIYQDERIPEDLKIGAEKVSHGRLAGAGTWGFYKCIFNAPFERRFEAEREVHKILASKRIVSNKEIFKCSILEAQVAIETVAIRNKLTAAKAAQQGVR